MRGQPREARRYELMTIFSPDVPEEEMGGQIDRIAGFVTDAGGTVQDTRRDSPWGRRRLAYPIRHGGRDLRDGFYTLFHIELEPHRIDDLERDLKLNDILIRHLVTTYVPQPIDPRAIEDAEVAAEDAAAEAYAAAQAEAARLATPAATNGDLSATTDEIVPAVSRDVITSGVAETETATDLDMVEATTSDGELSTTELPDTSADETSFNGSADIDVEVVPPVALGESTESDDDTPMVPDDDGAATMSADGDSSSTTVTENIPVETVVAESEEDDDEDVVVPPAEEV